jgi:methylenetetrahydrofolate dehydrogenase (NAD+)
MDSPTARKGLLLKADPIAATFKDEVKASLAQCTTRPRLVGILATTSAPSKNYAEFTKKQCEELGVDYVLKLTGAAASPELGEGEGVEEAIIEANEDESIHGIMVRDMILIRNNVDPNAIVECRIKVYFPIFGAQQVCSRQLI